MGSEPRTFGLEVKFPILFIVDTPPIESQQETISMPVQSRCLGPGFESPDSVFIFSIFLSQSINWSSAGQKMWNASRFCVSSLRRGHANLLCIVPILVYVLPKQVHQKELF